MNTKTGETHSERKPARIRGKGSVFDFDIESPRGRIRRRFGPGSISFKERANMLSREIPFGHLGRRRRRTYTAQAIFVFSIST